MTRRESEKSFPGEGRVKLYPGQWRQIAGLSTDSAGNGFRSRGGGSSGGRRNAHS